MYNAELLVALNKARGAWAIIRKIKRNVPPMVRLYKLKHGRTGEERARSAWSNLDVREGWAIIVDSDGKTIALTSVPWVYVKDD